MKKKKQDINFPVFVLLGIIMFAIIKFWLIAICAVLIAIVLFILVMVHRPELRAKVQAKIKQLKDKIL